MPNDTDREARQAAHRCTPHDREPTRLINTHKPSPELTTLLLTAPQEGMGAALAPDAPPAFHAAGTGQRQEQRPLSIDWRGRSQAPPDPVHRLDCVIDEQSVTEEPPRARELQVTGDGCIDMIPAPHFPTGPGGSVVAASKQAQTAHDAMAADLESFRHGERDPELRALGFLLPTKGKRATVDALAEQQAVPREGGAKVGSLFAADNRLNTTRADQHAVATAQRARHRGRGDVEPTMLGTLAADSALTGAMAGVQSAVERAKAATIKSQATALDYATAKYEEEAEEASDEIAELREEAHQSAEACEFVTSMLAGIVFATEGELGDAIEHVGVAAGLVLEHANDNRIKAAEHRLAASKKHLKSTKLQRIVVEMDKDRHTVLQSLAAVQQARSQLLQALTARRQAYNALGTASAASSEAGPRGQQHLAGALAAIPIVELVVARASALRQESIAPAYDEDAGHQLALATVRGNPKAGAFLRACGELDYTKLYFETVEADWQERLEALLQVKETVGGSRPGG